MLRTTRTMTRGDLLLAADHNLYYVALGPLLLRGWVRWVRDSTLPAIPTAVGYAVAAAVPVWAVGRNLPWFQWAASGAV